MSDIKINDVRPRVQYVQGDGAAAVGQFDFPFPVLDAADLRVAIDTTVLDAADYTVTGIGQETGGGVTLSVPPDAGSRVTIWRDMPFQRTTDFAPGADLRAAVLNDELDRTALLLQQAEALVGDSIHRRPYDEDIALVLPSIAERAGRILSFDSAGRPETVVARINADLTNFALIYLGPWNIANEPVLRLDGLPLQPGDLYFNTDRAAMMVYSGSDWATAYLPERSYLRADGSVAVSADMDFGGNSLDGIASLNGRDLDGAFSLLDGLVSKPPDPDQIARDATVLNAFEIARIDGLTAYAMANTYLDTFADQSGIEPGASTNAQYDADGRSFSGISKTVDDLSGAWVQDGTYPALGGIASGTLNGNGSSGACYYATAFSGDIALTFTMGGSGAGFQELGLVPVGQESQMAAIMASGTADHRTNGLSAYWSATGSVPATVIVAQNGAWGGVWDNGTRTSPIATGWAAGDVVRFVRTGARLTVYLNDGPVYDIASWGTPDVYLWFSHSDSNNPDWTGAEAAEYTVGGMTLTSVAVDAAASPETARVILVAEAMEASAFALGTDLTVEVSRDNGTEWTPVALQSIAAPSTTVGVYAGTVDLGAAAAGSVLRLRAVTGSDARVKLHRWAIQADEHLSV